MKLRCKLCKGKPGIYQSHEHSGICSVCHGLGVIDTDQWEEVIDGEMCACEYWIDDQCTRKDKECYNKFYGSVSDVK